MKKNPIRTMALYHAIAQNIVLITNARLAFEDIQEDQRTAWETEDALFNATAEVTWERKLIPKAGSKTRADSLGHEDCRDGHHVLSENPTNMLDIVGSMARTAVREQGYRSVMGLIPGKPVLPTKRSTAMSRFTNTALILTAIKRPGRWVVSGRCP